MHKQLTQSIIGCYYDVYNELGYGFLEAVYERAMIRTLQDAGIPHVAQQPITVWFRGERVGYYRADLVVANLVIVELKAARALDPAHEAQLVNYLKATSFEVGLLFNFGTEPEFRRILFSNSRKQDRGSGGFSGSFGSDPLNPY